MSFNMSDFCRCLQAGLKVNAAKFLSEKDAGWQPVIRAKDIEEFLATHKCEPIGDTPTKLILELLDTHDASDLPEGLYRRMEACTKK